MNALDQLMQFINKVRYQTLKEMNTAELIGYILTCIVDLFKNKHEHFKGYYSTISKLKEEHPTPQAGDSAYIGETWTVWEVKNGQWVNTGKAIPNDPEYINEVEKLRNQLYSEGDGKEYTRDVIVSTESMSSYLSLTDIFYKDYHLLHGKYIDSITFFAHLYKGNKINIIFAKNVGKSNYIREVREVEVVEGKQTISIKRQLDRDETIGLGMIFDDMGLNSLASVGATDSGNPTGGGILYKSREDSSWGSLDNKDLCLTVTERIFLPSGRGDILRLDDEKVSKNQFYHVSDENKFYDYKSELEARNAVPANMRAIGQIISYRLQDGKWITEQYIGLNLADWLQSGNWESGGIPTVPEVTEYIPYSEPPKTYTSVGYAFYYLNQSVLIGNRIDKIRLNVATVGILTVSVATGIPNERTVLFSEKITITTTGNQIISLPTPITLESGQYIGFGEPDDSATFYVNINSANPIAGGYCYYGSKNETATTRNLCIGIYSDNPDYDKAYATIGDLKDKVNTSVLYGVSNINKNYGYRNQQIARNAVPKSERVSGQIITYSLADGNVVTEQFVGDPATQWTSSQYWQYLTEDLGNPVELVPYSDTGTTSSVDFVLFYLNQDSIRGKKIDRIKLKVSKVGTLRVEVATGIPSTKVVKRFQNIEITTIGEQIVSLNEVIELAENEFIGFGSVDAIFLCDITAGNPSVGGYAWYTTTSNNVVNTSNDRNMCVGIIEENALYINSGSGGTTSGLGVIGLNQDKIVDIQSLTKKITTNLAPNKTDLFAFMHISDVHNDQTQIQRAFDALKGLGNIKFAINSGDTVLNVYSDPIDFYKNCVLTSAKPVYHCIGNHDVVNAPNVESVYNKHFAPLESKLGISTNGKTYYYKDIEGVRFIFLNEFDGSLAHNSFTTDEQLNWLIATLKTCQYAIIVIHQPPSDIVGTDIIDHRGNPISGYNDFFDFNTETIRYSYYAKNENPVVDIVEAWITGENINRTYTASGGRTNTVVTDFTTKGNFISYFSGHEHYDKFGYVGKTKQLNCTINCLRFQDVYADIPRISGTKSQDVIHIVGVNLNEKTLTIIRLGSDVAYQGRDRKKIIVSWDRAKLNT